MPRSVLISMILVRFFAFGVAAAKDVSPQAPSVPPQLQSSCPSVSPEQAKSWIGTYQAEEHSQEKGSAARGAKYQAEVSQDAEGVVRATVSTSGSITSPRLFTCGEVRKTQLILRLIGLEGGGMLPKGRELYQPALTIETDGPHAWMMGFPGVPSQLLNKPALRATKIASRP